MNDMQTILEKTLAHLNALQHVDPSDLARRQRRIDRSAFTSVLIIVLALVALRLFDVGSVRLVASLAVLTSGLTLLFTLFAARSLAGSAAAHEHLVRLREEELREEAEERTRALEHQILRIAERTAQAHSLNQVKLAVCEEVAATAFEDEDTRVRQVRKACAVVLATKAANG